VIFRAAPQRSEIRGVSSFGARKLPRPSNQRMKLSARGGRLVGNWLFLSVAAAGRSLCAIR